MAQPAAAPAVGTSTKVAPKPTSKPAKPGKVLGPDGYDQLKLGMTKEQALATGEISLDKPGADTPPGCYPYDLVDNPKPVDAWSVHLSPNHGVVSIEAGPAVRTPEGIGIGSTLAQAKAAYPSIRKGANGHFAQVPGNRNAVYYMGFDKNDRLINIALEHVKQDCFR